MTESGNFSEESLPTSAGHRKRLKERFDRTGFQGFADHEVIEMLLFYVIPRRDTKEIAKALLKKFGGIQEVYLASPESLKEVDGVGPEAARLFTVIRQLTEFVMRKKSMGSSPAITTVSEVVRYLSVAMANIPEEQFRVVFVDHANTIIRDEIMSFGTENQTAVFPRQVMKRALAVHATGILVAHNHPTGFLKPSQADRDITRALFQAANALDLRLLDHLIIGREGDGYFSFRENGLIS